MNPAVPKVVGIGIGLGVLVLILTRSRSGAVRITAGTSAPSYKWDADAGKCMRRVPVGTNPNGSTRFLVEVEPDAAMCFGGAAPSTATTTDIEESRELPTFAPNTIGAKTTDAISDVAGGVRDFLAGLFGQRPTAGALAGAVEATTTDDVEGGF